ncbi:hypothetical protein [uncultured Halomonas sp.]|uniref:hypothetical protein n=1 Tax=uncultured Halomonas sp. TaxID=173971 RepID=UPI00260DA1B0|nr:hypothetical protein [uncultured Halomonas sp.]
MTIDEWKRVANPWTVVEAAAESEAARDAAVVRIIDTLLELQLDRRHEQVGYQPYSVTGNVPMPRSTRAVDQCALAAERYRPDSEWHRACAWLLRQLPPRQAAAMLLQAARVRPERLAEGAVAHSLFAVTAKQMVERQDALLRALGMAEWAPRGFESVRAMQDCATRSRHQLRDWLKNEKVQQVA